MVIQRKLTALDNLSEKIPPRRDKSQSLALIGRTKVAQGLGFVEYVTDQVDGSCNLTHRMMFGGCTLYLDGKVVALICDDQLFVKPTRAGREFIGNVVEAPAYPGAKNSFLIKDQIEDGDWLTILLTVTAADLPVPKPRKKRPL